MTNLAAPGPLQWQVRIVDKDGKPTPDFIRWFSQLVGNGAALNKGKQEASRNLDAIAGLTGTGFAVRVNPSTWATRELTVEPELTETNGDGVAGNPVLGLADTTVVPGTYGDATHVGQFTVDAKGRLTFAANVEITGVVSGQILPVVDGSIPPVFLQNSDGSLIYAPI